MGGSSDQTFIGDRAVSLLAALGCAALAACKILPIPAAEDPEKLAASRADAAAALWSEKALPHFVGAAKPASEVITAINADFDAAASQYGYRPKAEGAPWTFIIRGTAKVTAKNDASRAGTLTVALDDQPSVSLTLQIGPVVRGNAVRDSLPFISFSDFENQLDFAEVGKSLNSQGDCRHRGRLPRRRSPAARSPSLP